ncbi:MAG: 5'-3' exonuclease H3TH domain-containing protein [Kofleriaceae bacterium]
MCAATAGRLGRAREVVLDEAGVHAKFGVAPASIPDYLALVGDTADGIPGLPRFGARTVARLLARYPHLEDIPADASAWDVEVRGAAGLAQTLRERAGDARLYRTLATLREDADVDASPAAVRWRGVDGAALATLGARIGLDPATLRLPVAGVSAG